MKSSINHYKNQSNSNEKNQQEIHNRSPNYDELLFANSPSDKANSLFNKSKFKLDLKSLEKIKKEEEAISSIHQDENKLKSPRNKDEENNFNSKFVNKYF